jgi:hypothetical protein
MQAIAELLAGLLVELFRELQQWWWAARDCAPPRPRSARRLRRPSRHHRGTAGPDGPSPPAANTIFEIGR